MKGLTISLGKTLFIFFAVVLSACGGKSQRVIGRQAPPIRSSPSPPVAPSSPETPDFASSAPRGLESIAPTPIVRVGLSTRSGSVRLTSSRPFRIGAGESWFSTYDVLVERDSRGTVEGWSYSIQIASFPEEAPARDLRGRVAEETGESVTIEREPVTGRFAVRLGNFSTTTSAETVRRELSRSGYEWAETVREPVQVPRPRGLILRPIGHEPVALKRSSIYAIPERAGAWIEVDGAPYRGYVELLVNGSSLFTTVNVVNLEDYLKGVVPAELSPASFPQKEAIKAQAIAARTYVLKRRGQYESEGYDVCATPACQVYRGVGVEQTMSNDAVDETSGEVLTYQGEPVDALYTSTCGGRTENAENVFSEAVPYLVSRACYLESSPPVVSSTNGPGRSLEAATLEVLGVLDGPETATLGRARVVDLLGRALSVLGQQPCWRDSVAVSTPFDIVDLTGVLAEGLCWQRRLPFLLSSFDATRLVPLPRLSDLERRYLGYAIQEGLVVPPAEGIRRGVPLSEAELYRTLYALLSSRGEGPLTAGTLVSFSQGRLTLRDDALADEDNRISSSLAAERYLFRRVGGSTFYAPELVLLPNDRVLYHLGDSGVDLLVLISEGGSFDRSSRFSHWVVRKSNGELSREVNAREEVGEIVDLRPKRYGRSGRVAELEIVGTRATRTLRGLAIRRALGIRENLFFLDAQRDPTGELRGWVFTGRGWGHGVGLCQVGAYGMAAAGYDYRQILSHYYPGTRLERGARVAGMDHVDKAHRAP